jgi:PEP-CTERM motif
MSTDVDWYSNAADNSDGVNHAYATAFTGDASGIPAGTYVGFEDRAEVAITTITTTPVASSAPEASTWAMMLIGFAGLGFAGWRVRRKTAAPTA